MTIINDIFNTGPQAITGWFAQQSRHSTADDMTAKELADIAWSRASTLAKTDPNQARKWAAAALAGYDYLAQHGQPAAAESAAENAEALRSWSLLKQPAHENPLTKN